MPVMNIIKSRGGEKLVGNTGAGTRKIFESNFSKEIKIFCPNQNFSQFFATSHILK